MMDVAQPQVDDAPPQQPDEQDPIQLQRRTSFYIHMEEEPVVDEEAAHLVHPKKETRILPTSLKCRVITTGICLVLIIVILAIFTPAAAPPLHIEPVTTFVNMTTGGK